MISLSLRPPAHPSCFQPTPVRASTACYSGFTLARGITWLRVYATRLSPYSDSLSLRLRPLSLTSPRSSNSPAHYAKGTRSGLPLRRHSPPTACRQTVSGSISLPSPGFFSPFPHGTGSLSVAREYLALEGGPPRFPRGCTCPVVLGRRHQRDQCDFVYGLSPAVAALSRAFDYRLICNSGSPMSAPQPKPDCSDLV